MNRYGEAAICGGLTGVTFDQLVVGGFLCLLPRQKIGHSSTTEDRAHTDSKYEGTPQGMLDCSANNRAGSLICGGEEQAAQGRDQRSPYVAKCDMSIAENNCICHY